MNILIKIFEWLAAERGTLIQPYSAFHLTFVVITVIASILMCVFFRNASDRGVRRICLVMWLIIVVLEIYKQIVFTFDVQDGRFVADYWWNAFPFQLCSSPHYILPLVIFLRDGKLRDAATAFMIAFSIFGGLCVYVFPGDVFSYYIGVNYQTMIHHGIQIVAGVYLASRYRSKLTIKYYLKGGAVFLVLLGVAMLLNEVVYRALVYADDVELFNMFFVSPYFDCTLPVLSAIYPLVPYPVFLMIYAIGFFVAAAIIFYAAKGLVVLMHNIRARVCKNAA